MTGSIFQIRKQTENKERSVAFEDVGGGEGGGVLLINLGYSNKADPNLFPTLIHNIKTVRFYSVRVLQPIP